MISICKVKHVISLIDLGPDDRRGSLKVNRVEQNVRNYLSTLNYEEIKDLATIIEIGRGGVNDPDDHDYATIFQEYRDIMDFAWDENPETEITSIITYIFFVPELLTEGLEFIGHKI